MDRLEQSHQRYAVQATWTESQRWRLLRQFGLGSVSRLLDIGCGTGVITSQLSSLGPARVFGLDIDVSALRFARQGDRRSHYLQGDAHRLPMPSGCFDLTICHYLLLWVDDPGLVLGEMARLTRPGGAVLALAEPDYGGRVDHPAAMQRLGRLQTQSLRDQGADPFVGRRLSELFLEAGLVQVGTGVLGGEWTVACDERSFQSEWETLAADLGEILPADQMVEMRQLVEQAWRTGRYTLFVPTFFASGVVPDRG